YGVKWMRITVVRGKQAISSLADDAFGREWNQLHAACPWATVFQSRNFVTTWERIYEGQYEPVLVVGRADNGQLVGLIPLARSTRCGKLVPAGAHHAEYQGWICLPDFAGDFPSRAFASLRLVFPGATLRFRYMPAGIPVEWPSDDAMARRSLLHSGRRPLIYLGDGQAIRQSLAKSGNKSRIRQLKRNGTVEFRRVTDPAEFVGLIDEIAVFHDCRQLRHSGVAPFQEDGLKRVFHLELMRNPGLLHVTTLCVDGRLVSAHLNVVRGGEVQLYLIAHNPLFARFSPGKLHLLFLAEMLHGEGYTQIDLTPGGDAYKERFANAADRVASLAVFPSFARRLVGAAAAAAVVQAKDRLRRLDVTPAELKAWLDRRFRTTGSAPAAGGSCEVRKDCLEHLLTYHAGDDLRSRRRFLSDALDRFERGEHVFSSQIEGRVTVFGWTPEEAPAPPNVLASHLPPALPRPPSRNVA
ncbi:MAG TPA: GNAT family N-acetyltransferase, partial [Tepidisphaeraceae bacterium]|nr:GNAT family N-acetyltransferase [Tepidisphaeraceae bacterium]